MREEREVRGGGRKKQNKEERESRREKAEERERKNRGRRGIELKNKREENITSNNRD